MKYQMKRIQVEAFHWRPGEMTSKETDDFFQFMRPAFRPPEWRTDGFGAICVVLIDGAEGPIRANPGDWIARGVGWSAADDYFTLPAPAFDALFAPVSPSPAEPEEQQ